MASERGERRRGEEQLMRVCVSVCEREKIRTVGTFGPLYGVQRVLFVALPTSSPRLWEAPRPPPQSQRWQAETLKTWPGKSAGRWGGNECPETRSAVVSTDGPLKSHCRPPVQGQSSPLTGPHRAPAGPQGWVSQTAAAPMPRQL